MSVEISKVDRMRRSHEYAAARSGIRPPEVEDLIRAMEDGDQVLADRLAERVCPIIRGLVEVKEGR